MTYEEAWWLVPMMTDATGRLFDFLGGALPLDFCNTVDWHTSPEPHDRFVSYSDVLSWTKQAGTLAGSACNKILNRMEADEDQAGYAHEAFRRTVAVREAMFRIFAAHARSQTPMLPDIEKVRNRWSEAVQLSNLEYDGGKYVFTWNDNPDVMAGPAYYEQPIFPVIRAAVELLCSPQLAQVKMCEGPPGCGWLFIDTTKNRSRRWCSMRDCGNRAKMRRFYGKRREQTGSGNRVNST